MAGSHLFQDEVFLSCGTQVAELDLDRGQQQARTEIRWMTRKVLFENDRHVAQIARRGGQRDERVQRFFASRIGDQGFFIPVTCRIRIAQSGVDFRQLQNRLNSAAIRTLASNSSNARKWVLRICANCP